MNDALDKTDRLFPLRVPDAAPTFGVSSGYIPMPYPKMLYSERKVTHNGVEEHATVVVHSGEEEGEALSNGYMTRLDLHKTLEAKHRKK